MSARLNPRCRRTPGSSGTTHGHHPEAGSSKPLSGRQTRRGNSRLQRLCARNRQGQAASTQLLLMWKVCEGISRRASCSRNARPEKALVRRAQVNHTRYTLTGRNRRPAKSVLSSSANFPLHPSSRLPIIPPLRVKNRRVAMPIVSFPYQPEHLAFCDKPVWISATDGDTPTFQLPIRMLGIDSPELHYQGASATTPSKYDIPFSAFLTAAGKDLDTGLKQYLSKKLLNNACVLGDHG